MLITLDEVSVRRDDNSRKTKPASVGWTTTVLQSTDHRCEGCGFGWVNIEDVVALLFFFAAFLDLIDAAMHLSMAKDRVRDVCHTEE
jgi:hypothetical protein